MSPAEIQAELNRLGNNREAIQRFLSTVSAEDYAAWARSSQRASSVGGGALETVLGPLLGAAAAPFVGPGAVASIPAAGRQIAGAVSSRMGLGSTTRDLATLGGATTAAGLATRALTGGNDSAQGTRVTPSLFDFGIRGLPEEGATTSDAETASLVGRLMVALGISQEEAETLLFEEGVAGALKILQQGGAVGGGGGGSSRFLFPEEAEALRLDNELKRRQLAGELGFQEIQPGFFVDPITGAQYDRNAIDQKVRELEELTRQYDTTFDEEVRQYEKTFAENARQFDVTESRLRDQLNLDTEIRRRERGLAETEFVADVLRNPADFLARAFLQRGVESPLQQISQADIVSSLRNAISSASGGVVSPQGSLLGGTTGNATTNTPASPPPPPQQSRFGAAAPVVGGENTPTASMMSSTEAIRQQAAQAGIPTFVGTEGKLWTHDPNTQQWVEYQPPAAPVQPTAPVTPQVNSPLLAIDSQQQIVDMARQYSPPAVNALLAGTTEEMQPLNLGFATPTPRQMSRLTPAETEAFGTRLAAEFNTDLSDLAAQQSQLFGQTRSRGRGRLLT